MNEEGTSGFINPERLAMLQHNDDFAAAAPPPPPQQMYSEPPRETRMERERARDERPPRDDDRHRSPPRRRRSRSKERRGKFGIPGYKRRVPREIYTGWDKAPAGYEGMSVQQVAGVNPTLILSRMPTAASVPAGLLPEINTTTGVIQAPQMRQARRLYVGNIPAGISEKAICEYFNRLLLESQDPNLEALQMEPPVLSAQVNEEKSFAFLEFRTPDEATRCCAFDGVELAGHTLRVRRPKDYQGATPNVPVGGPEVIPAVGVISTQVPDTEYKIFVGGVPAYLTEDSIKELLMAFGDLAAFNLVKDSLTGISKGYAFAMYRDVTKTDIACAGLNGMQIGDKKLVVQRASVGAKKGMGLLPGMLGVGQLPAELMGMPNPVTGLTTATGVPEAGNSLTAASVAAAAVTAGLQAGITLQGGIGQATQIVVLFNMVTPEELYDLDDYEDIKEDIQEECSKFGQILSLQIPRPTPENPNVPGVGKIFIEYGSVEEARLAHDELSGRKFGGRTVITSYISFEDYHARNF